VTYFTSSPLIQRLVREQGADAFDYSVRKRFDTGTQARLWEHKVLRRLKAVGRSDWYNRGNGQPPHNRLTRAGQGAGRRLSENHKASISRATRGKSKTITPAVTAARAEYAKLRVGRPLLQEVRVKIAAANQSRAPVFEFAHPTEGVFMGPVFAWAERYQCNKKSALTLFSAGRPYRGWIRRMHTLT
jgi:hypothetical protein